MKTFCVYTPSAKKSTELSDRLVKTGNQFNISVEKFKSIDPFNLTQTVEKENLVLKYKPVKGLKTDFDEMTAPITRICNGLTHYLLYLKCISDNQCYMILEHDAYFVGKPPSVGIYDGVIQISSHNTYQMNSQQMKGCVRAQKMFKHQPEYCYNDNWDTQTGIIKHPLTGTNGTSGYIIGPNAAKKMVEYIRKDGIAFADRIRSEHIGEGNLYLQYPFSVFCSDKL